MRIMDTLTPDEEKRIAAIDERYRPLFDASDARLDAAMKLYFGVTNGETAANYQAASEAASALRNEWMKERGAIQEQAEIRAFERYATNLDDMIAMIKEEIPRHIAFMGALSDPDSKPTAQQKAESEKRIAEEEAKILEAIAHNEALLQKDPDNIGLAQATKELQHMYHSGEWKMPYLTHYEIFFSDDAIRENINEGFSRYLQHLSVNSYDDYKKILAYIEVCIGNKEIILAAGKQSSKTDTQARQYRTKATAGAVVEKLPATIALPTLSGFQNATSLHQDGDAYLQELEKSAISKLKFSNGKIYFDGSIKPISEVELQNIKTKEGIQEIDLPLLRMFYSIILNEFEKTNYTVLKDVITIYIPELAECMGMKRNTSADNISAIIAKAQTFHNFIGVYHYQRNGKPDISLYPVLNFEGYSSETNTISFSSPYMNMIIKEICKIATRKDKKGNPILKRNGTPLFLPSHSYLLPASITKERNKAAVENVKIILTTIEQCGDHKPHISAYEIVKRNEQLFDRMQRLKNPSDLLRTTFKKTWELLQDKTTLTEVYDGIVLPDPNDPANIPTMRNLKDLVFEFPHKGKKKK